MTRVHQDIRRLADGSIDYGHYRRKAMALRSRDMTALFKTLGAGLKPRAVFTAMTSVLFAVAI